MLYQKANLLLEMGESQLERYKDEIKENPEVLVIVGYIYEQALELILKYLAKKITGEYPKNHKVYLVANHIRYYIKNKEFDGKERLEKQLKYLDKNTRKYELLAYGAKYVDNLNFTYDDFLDIQDQVFLLKIWIHNYGKSF